MRKTRKIIICSDETDWGQNFIDNAKIYGAELYFVKKNGHELLDLIKSISPYLVYTELFLPNIDALTIINILNSSSQKLPAFIVSSSYENKIIENRLNEFDLNFISIPPSNTEFISELILNTLHRSTYDMIIFDNNKELNIEISNALHHLGVPAHLKGYTYLRDCIMFSILDPNLNSGMTKKLYMMIAEIYDTKHNKVERCIRHAIQTAWDRHDDNAYMDYFIRKINRKPSNTEFITILASKLNRLN